MQNVASNKVAADHVLRKSHQPFSFSCLLLFPFVLLLLILCRRNIVVIVVVVVRIVVFQQQKKRERKLNRKQIFNDLLQTNGQN